MATTLTRNLKLRINSNLTSDAKYNLERLDTLGSTFVVDTTNTLKIRSTTNILIEPESADIGGAGAGGTIEVGTASHILDQISLFGTNVYIGPELQLPDLASGANRRILIKYKTDISGPVDTVADRSLFIDLDTANRNLVLGGDLWILGNDVLKLTTTADTDVTLPLTGVLATLDNPEILTNKTINADNNTILNIRDVNVNPSAAIAYTKLALTNSIVNADVNTSAAIQYSKLSLTGGILNADINASAAIAYSKLQLAGSIVNNDISGSANINGTKVNPDFGSQNIRTFGQLRLYGPTYYSSLQASASQIADIPYTLPAIDTAGVLSSDGAGNLNWIAVSGTGSVTSVALAAPAEFTVSGSPVTTSGTLTLTKQNQTQNTVWAGPTTGSPAAPAFRALVAGDLPTGVVTAATDTSSVDHTILAGSLSSVVLPAGVDHDQLLNFAANEHIDHTAVSITTASNSGLAGGGTIAATRSLSIDPANAPSVTVAGSDIVLIGDASNANALSRTTVADIVALASGSVTKSSTDWITGDGTTKVFAHNIGSLDVDITIYDKTDGATILVDSELRTDTNTVTLTSTQAPGAAGWRVVVTG